MSRIVNVGGTRFETLVETLLNNSPNYFSARLAHGKLEGEWFVDRSPEIFAHVLAFQRGYVLHLSQPEHAMLLQDAQYYGILPLITFCKAQLGAPPRELLDALEAALERCQEEADTTGRPIPSDLLDTVHEACEAGDKEAVQEALHQLAAWHAVPEWKRMWLMATTGLEMADQHWPEWRLGDLHAAMRRMLDEPETEQHLFRAALHSVKAPEASPLHQLMFAVLTRLATAWLMRGFRPAPAPAPPLNPGPALADMFADAPF